MEIALEKKKSYFKKLLKDIVKKYDLYLLILPTIIFFIVFRYAPMYGIQIAFKDFVAPKGIWGSEWIGFEHFKRFFDSYYFTNIIKNTIGVSIYQLIAGFPMPIILALFLNEVKEGRFKKIVQTTTYAPHFISTVVMVGIVITFLSPSNGIINQIICAFGGEPINFMASPKWFKTIFVFSGIWQNTGWGTIIYLAALAGVNKELHDAAAVDGANRFQKMIHINIPAIMPTAIILLIMNTGRIMNVGFEKVFLMQNALNIESSEVIATFVYKSGLQNGEYGYSAAVGLFKAVINCGLLIVVNRIARKVSDTSLW